MSDRETDQIESQARIERSEDAPLTVEPFRSVEEQNRPEAYKSRQAANLEQDQWERLPLRGKAMVIGVLIFILICVCVFTNAIEKKVEYIFAGIATIFVALVSLNQYYVSKKQWYVATQGLEKTEVVTNEMMEQRKILERQANSAHAQSAMMREALKQAEEHFKVLNRPVMNIEKVRWLDDLPQAGMEAGKPWRVIVDMRNFGGMIAHVRLNDATLEAVPMIYVSDPCPDPVKSTVPRKSLKMAVAPKSAFSVTLHLPRLSEEDIFGFWSDDIVESHRWKRVALWLDLTFTDPFGKGYGFRYHAIFNRAAFVPCHEHCESD